jgi:rhodanese-related sulfurtransferase
MSKTFRMMMVLMIFVALLFMGCSEKEAAAPAQEAAPAAAQEAPEETFSVREFVEEYIADLAEGNNIVSMDKFVEDVIAGADVYIIDIRRAEDYEKGHAKGAVNVPWGSSAMWEEIPYLPQNGTVYLHCYSGQTAGQAIVMMQMAGIPAVSVNSGWNLGISRVEGYEAILETTPNPIDRSSKNDVPSAVMDTIRGYYEEMAGHAGTPFANNMVSEENAKGILDAKDDAVQFVSMRRPDDFAKAHIETAINVPFGPGMYDMVSMLPSDKKLVSYCYSGQTANQGIALLRLLGYDAVSLLYGMGTPRTDPRGWVNSGYPVVASN